MEFSRISGGADKYTKKRKTGAETRGLVDRSQDLRREPCMIASIKASREGLSKCQAVRAAFSMFSASRVGETSSHCAW